MKDLTEISYYDFPPPTNQTRTEMINQPFNQNIQHTCSWVFHKKSTE